MNVEHIEQMVEQIQKDQAALAEAKKDRRDVEEILLDHVIRTALPVLPRLCNAIPGLLGKGLPLFQSDTLELVLREDGSIWERVNVGDKELRSFEPSTLYDYDKQRAKRIVAALLTAIAAQYTGALPERVAQMRKETARLHAILTLIDGTIPK